MAKKSLGYQRIVGLVVATLIVMVLASYGWGLVFDRQGTGANFIIGLLVGGAFVYYGAGALAPLVSDLLFRASFPRWRSFSSLTRYAKEIEFRLGANKGAEVGDEFHARATKLLARVQKELRMHVQSDSRDVKSLQARCADVLKDWPKESQNRSQDGGSQGSTKSFSVRGFFSSLPGAVLLAVMLRLFVVEPFQIPSASMIPTLLIGDHLFVSRLSYGIRVPGLDKYFLRWSEPKAGEVVVFTSPDYVPENRGTPWIKRVIATGGDTLKIREDKISVNGQAYSQKMLDPHATYKNHASGFGWRIMRNNSLVEESMVEGKETILHQSLYQNNNASNLGSRMRNFPNGIDLTGLDCGIDECVVKKDYVFVMGDNRGNSTDGRVWGAVHKDNIRGKALTVWLSVDGSEHMLSLGGFFLPEIRWSKMFSLIR